MRPWSYSRLTTWEECPRRYQYNYVMKVEGKKEPHIAASRGTEIHAKGEAYLKGELQLYPPEFQKVSGHTMYLKSRGAQPEVKLGVREDWSPCEFDDPDTYLRVIIDILLLDEGVLDVQDWKTGRIYDHHVNQLELYVAVAAAHHPEVTEYRSRAVYIDQGVIAKPVVTKPDRVKPIRMMIDGRIKNAEEDKIYPTRAGSHCRWCDYSKQHGGPCQF